MHPSLARTDVTLMHVVACCWELLLPFALHCNTDSATTRNIVVIVGTTMLEVVAAGRLQITLEIAAFHSGDDQGKASRYSMVITGFPSKNKLDVLSDRRYIQNTYVIICELGILAHFLNRPIRVFFGGGGGRDNFPAFSLKERVYHNDHSRNAISQKKICQTEYY